MITPEQRFELSHLIRESEHAALDVGIKGAQSGSAGDSPEYQAAREARRDAWRALGSYLDSITDRSTYAVPTGKDA